MSEVVMNKPKTKPVNFHCPEPLHAALTELARREGESVATLLRMASRELCLSAAPSLKQRVL